MNWILWTMLGAAIVLLAIFPRFIILFVQGVFLAFGQVWTNKLRSFLTTIGIVIGVASVTSVIAALSGLETNVLTEFEKFGTNKIFINPARTASDYARRTPWAQIRFGPHIFDNLLSETPSLSAYTRTANSSDTVTFEQRKIQDVTVVGIDPSWHAIQRRSVITGRPFSLIDVQRGLPVCLVDPVLQQSLNLNRDPTGQSIVVGERRFTVVGVVEPEQSSAMFGGGDNTGEVYLPFTTSQRLEPRLSYSVIATSRTTEIAEEAVAELTFYMRQVRHVKPGGEDSFRVFFIAEQVKQFKTMSTVIRAVATCIVGISLVVGGVGIMNIMLVSVSERTREIGLRKAVGANPLAILLQFLIEAVTLCCIGGAVGLACGYGLVRLMRSVPMLQLENAVIPFWAVMLSFGFSAGVGLLFGMFPAIKAARLDPIDALRHE